MKGNSTYISLFPFKPTEKYYYYLDNDMIIDLIENNNLHNNKSKCINNNFQNNYRGIIDHLTFVTPILNLRSILKI